MVSYLATAMVAVSVLQYLLHAVPVIIGGHRGQLALSVVAIATSITEVNLYHENNISRPKYRIPNQIMPF